MRLYFYLAIVLFPFLSACSSSGFQDYSTLVNNPEAMSYNDKITALKNSETKPINIGKSQKIKIRMTDKAFIENKVINNFQVMQLDVADSSLFTFNIASPCYECLGFRKKAMLPKVEIFDSRYNLVTEIESQFNSLAMGFYGEKDIYLDKGEYAILVSADNNALYNQYKSDVKTAHTGVVLTPVPLPISMSTSPEGNVFLKIKKTD